MKVFIVYDGKCPVCSRLAAASRLKERASELELIDARGRAVDSVQPPGLRAATFVVPGLRAHS